MAPSTLGLLLAATHVLGQVGVTVPNWTVPPYHGSSAGLTTMTDFTPPRAFVGVTPCRVVDTRNANGPYGGPALATNVARTFDIDNGGCGIPTGVEAYSLNFGGILPPADGFLTAWPTGIAQPVVSQLNLVGGEVVANAAIVPAGTNGAINVLVNIGPTNVYIDINGYFSDTLGNTANSLVLNNNSPGTYTAAFVNAASANNSSGVTGAAGPGFPVPSYYNAGVVGESILTGVLGKSQTQGVAGSLLNGGGGETAWGVVGFHVVLPDPAIAGLDVGVFGNTYSSAAQAAGVIGYAPAGSGAIAGVRGLTGSSSNGAAGVRGQDGGGPVPLLWPGTFPTAGVRGESHGGFGVLGYTDLWYGVYGSGNSATSWGGLACKTHGPSVGVCGSNISSAGIVSFSEPHPTDPSKTIRYISLEGNEAGTYFRGRGKFQNGIAVIEVPEDFRIVTDPEGLSIQVTPIGQMATVAVESIGLDRIVVRGSRNVEFFYLVNGLRQAYKDSGPIADDVTQFVPRSADEPMPPYLPAVLQQRLISNGTYTADGKVNMETARRLGWDRIWEHRSRHLPEPTP